MSRPYSKYRVAVTVDQRIMSEEAIPPAIEWRSANIDRRARKVKGIREYPRMLIVL